MWITKMYTQRVHIPIHVRMENRGIDQQHSVSGALLEQDQLTVLGDTNSFNSFIIYYKVKCIIIIRAAHTII